MKAKKAKKAKLAYSIDEHLVRFHEKAARAALKLADRYLKGSAQEPLAAKKRRLRRLTFWTNTAAMHDRAAAVAAAGIDQGHIHSSGWQSYWVPWSANECKCRLEALA